MVGIVKSILKILMLLACIVVAPIVLWILGSFIVGILGLPWFLNAANQNIYWKNTPTYIQMPDATFKIDPEFGPTINSKKEKADSAFVPSNKEGERGPFRLFKSVYKFSLRCYKEYNCIPGLTKTQASVNVTFSDDSPKFYPSNPLERLESFDSNFDYSPTPAERYGGIKVEFSLISKDPLYFGSYVAVLCGPDTRGAHIESRICYFEAPKAALDQSSYGVTAPGINLSLSSAAARSPDVEISETNVYHPELWPEIIKRFEQVILESHVPALQVKQIEEMAEGHWQADRQSRDYKH